MTVSPFYLFKLIEGKPSEREFRDIESEGEHDRKYLADIGGKTCCPHIETSLGCTWIIGANNQHTKKLNLYEH